MTDLERIARSICDRNPDAQVTLFYGQTFPDRTRRRVLVEGTTIPAWKLFEHKAMAIIKTEE